MLNQKRIAAIKRIVKEEKDHIAQFQRLLKDAADDLKFGRLADHMKQERLISLLVKDYPYLDGEISKQVACPEPPKNIYQMYSNVYAPEDFLPKEDSDYEPPQKRRKVEIKIISTPKRKLKSVIHVIRPYFSV